jgi:hypothetical protein
MKIIDLLNKIANGEEVPKKIKYKNKIYNYEKFNIGYGKDYFNAEWKIEKGYRHTTNNNSYIYLNINDYCLNDEIEIIEENKKELHANNIEFNIYDDKKEFIITLDENDLGIDKLHLDNCYFYKENDKWYVKHINLKPIAYISQEHKIPEKINIQEMSCRKKWSRDIDVWEKINEILDYLEVNNE